MAQIQTNAGAISAQNVFTPTRGEHDGRRRQWTVLGLAIVGIAAVVMGSLLYVRTQEAPATTVPAIVNGVAAERAAFEAYAPGGSVYQQQVPAAATSTGESVYTAGGSVYQQQVPAAATTTGESVYAPGGSVYQQQVPAETSGESVYAPGGSVYEQQVP